MPLPWKGAMLDPCACQAGIWLGLLSAPGARTAASSASAHTQESTSNATMRQQVPQQKHCWHLWIGVPAREYGDLHSVQKTFHARSVTEDVDKVVLQSS